jgi:hypothetical protein
MPLMQRSSVQRIAGTLLATTIAIWACGCGATQKKPATGAGQPVTTVRMGPRSAAAARAAQQADPGAGTAVAPITNNDPCASRLHQICGPLLLYYAMNRHLPDTLDELLQVPGFNLSATDFTCPVSRLPYIYDPRGTRAPASAGGTIILADATPAHSHLRWAVSIVEPKDPGGALIAKVIAVPESYFTSQAQPPQQ